MEYALELKGLTKSYGDFTLDALDIRLPGGCIMGFIGENGAGKTTTIKLILELIFKDEGSVSILGYEGEKAYKVVKENIGVVLDECNFPEILNAREINHMMKRVYKTWDSNIFYDYMARFKLDTKKQLKAYSRGMKMKIAIAVALSHASKILILDEATSGLDPLVREEILDVFLEFIQDESHSIFMSSHIISDLEKVCDYITLIHHGKLVFTAPKDELIEKFVLLKCSESELKEIPPNAVYGIKRNHFGIEALVERSVLTKDHVFDRASIEDIMLYHIKEVSA